MTLMVSALGAVVLGFATSFLMTRASNRSAAWNIAIGACVALTLAGAIYIAVILIERNAFK